MSAPGFRDFAWRLRKWLRRALLDLRLEWTRHRLLGAEPGSRQRVGPFTLRITDGANAYMQWKDELVRRSYAFEHARDPVVIDGGANMGLFTLSTLRDHPGAKITAFEPDPAVFAILRENLERNGASHVTCMNAALGGSEGEMSFTPDGEAGGALSADGVARVKVVPLSHFIGGGVDFLKLNIEGAELDVLREAAASGALARVRAMVFEYHGWAAGEQRLGALLDLLAAQGFRYLVHDQDEQSNPVSKPPFRPQGSEPWFALVYAWR